MSPVMTDIALFSMSRPAPDLQVSPERTLRRVGR
jgi:hypothetical protein